MKFALLSAAVLCVAAALPGDDAAAIATQKASYPLTTCVVSGKPLASPGMTPVDKLVNGQLVEFCCGKCPAEFDKSPAEYMKKIQDAVVAAQKDRYPLDTCPVSGEKLDAKAISVVQDTKLVKLCCSDCKKDLAADPAKFIAKLDAAYIAAQEKDYPLAKCPISGEALGDRPVKMLYGTTLVEFCCKDCIADFQKDPKAVLEKIKIARLAKAAAPADGKTAADPKVAGKGG
jgi:YHS domain-containing protein